MTSGIDAMKPPTLPARKDEILKTDCLKVNDRYA